MQQTRECNIKIGTNMFVPYDTYRVEYHVSVNVLVDEDDDPNKILLLVTDNIQKNTHVHKNNIEHVSQISFIVCLGFLVADVVVILVMWLVAQSWLMFCVFWCEMNEKGYLLLF